MNQIDKTPLFSALEFKYTLQSFHRTKRVFNDSFYFVKQAKLVTC